MRRQRQAVMALRMEAWMSPWRNGVSLGAPVVPEVNAQTATSLERGRCVCPRVPPPLSKSRPAIGQCATDVPVARPASVSVAAPPVIATDTDAAAICASSSDAVADGLASTTGERTASSAR